MSGATLSLQGLDAVEALRLPLSMHFLSDAFRPSEVSLHAKPRKGEGVQVQVRAVLAALAPRVAACEERMEGTAQGRALAGLRSCRDSAEAHSLLAALLPKVDQLAGPIILDS